MSPAELLGFASGAIGMMQALPQAQRVRSLGHGRGVSLAAWVLQFTVGAAWCGYGIRIASPSVAFTNVIATSLTGTVVFALLSDRPRVRPWLPVFGIATAALAAVLPMAITSAVLVALTVSRTPQVRQSYRTYLAGHPTAVSLPALGVSMVSLIGWEVYAVMVHRGLMLLTTSIALALTVIIASIEYAAGRRHALATV